MPETDHSHRESREDPSCNLGKSIEEGEAKMLRGIPKEDVELCKQVLWQMYENRKNPKIAGMIFNRNNET